MKAINIQPLRASTARPKHVTAPGVRNGSVLEESIAVGVSGPLDPQGPAGQCISYTGSLVPERAACDARDPYSCQPPPSAR